MFKNNDSDSSHSKNANWNPLGKLFISWSNYLAFSILVLSTYNKDSIFSSFAGWIVIPYYLFITSLVFMIIYIFKANYVYSVLFLLLFLTRLLSYLVGVRIRSGLFPNWKEAIKNVTFAKAVIVILKYFFIANICYYGFGLRGIIMVILFLILEVYTVTNVIELARKQFDYWKTIPISQRQLYGIGDSSMEDLKYNSQSYESFSYDDIGKMVDGELSVDLGRGKMVEDFNRALNYETEFQREGNIEKHFRPDGSLILQCIVNEDGIRDGYYEAFYPSGLTYSKGAYHGGILNGPLNNFFPNGKLSFMTEMLMGREHGDSVTYYEDGSIQSEAIYSHGVLISRKVHKLK